MGETLKDRLVVTSDTKFLMVVREFVVRLVRQSLLAREEENKVTLAVDEAVTNIIEHGYESGIDGQIEVEVEADEAQFKIVIRDTGKSFNPEGVPEPDMNEHVAAGRKRGLGIFLMRQIMDEVRYRFKEGIKNELTLVKYIK